MALIKEDLSAISHLMDEHMKKVETGFNKIETRLNKIETRLNKIETRLNKVETRLNKIEVRLDKLEFRLEQLETRQDELEFGMKELQESQNKIRDIQEKEIIPRMQIIEECYLSTFERYKEKNEKFDNLESDVNVLKHVVQKHSEMLEKIS